MQRPLDDVRRAETVNVLTYEMSDQGKALVVRCEFAFSERSDPQVNGCTYSHPTPAWTRLFVVVKGWLEITIGGRTRRLAAPGIHLIPTAQPFTARYHIIDVHVFHLGLTDLAGISLTAGLTSVISLHDRAAVASLAGRCRSGTVAACQAEVFQVVMRMLSPALPRIMADQVEFGPFRQLAESIRSSLHDGLGIRDFARQLGVPQADLVRRFRRTCGITLRSYIAGLKFDEARKLLVYSDAEVGSIGETLGFSDRFYFYRSFKRWTGVSPQEYRRRHRPPGAGRSA